MNLFKMQRKSNLFEQRPKALKGTKTYRCSQMGEMDPVISEHFMDDYNCMRDSLSQHTEMQSCSESYTVVMNAKLNGSITRQKLWIMTRKTKTEWFRPGLLQLTKILNNSYLR